MQTPVKPRYDAVAVQLHDLEMGILGSIGYDVNLEWWIDIGEPDPEYLDRVDNEIATTFENLRNIYNGSSVVSTLLTQSRILIQNCAWTALAVPFPGIFEYFHVHIDTVKHNLIRVYDRQIYEPLRQAMIRANHQCEVIQRVWRRCDTDPAHPMCRRRLDRQFEEFSSDLNNRCV